LRVIGVLISSIKSYGHI